MLPVDHKGLISKYIWMLSNSFAELITAGSLVGTEDNCGF